MCTDYILSHHIMTVLKTVKIKLGNIFWVEDVTWLQDNFDRQKEQPSIEICLTIQFQPRCLFTFCYWRCILLVVKGTRVRPERSKIKDSSLDKWIHEKQDQRTGLDKWPKWIQGDLSCQLSEWLLEIPIWKTILKSWRKSLSFPQQRSISENDPIE